MTNIKVLCLTLILHLYTVTDFYYNLYALCMYTGSTRWRMWLRHCATGRRVTGSVPQSRWRHWDFFYWLNPSCRTL